MEFIVRNSGVPVWPPKDGRPRMDDRERRSREIANFLWKEEGCPDGLADQHWAAAKAVVNARASLGSAGATPADGRDTDAADIQALIHESSVNILARLDSLEKRHDELGVEVGRLAKSLELGDPERVDMALRQLGKRMHNGVPQSSYFNIRFRNFEIAMTNLRTLGYAIGRKTAEEKLLGRVITTPTAHSLKSKVCTQADMESDWALFWLDAMRLPRVYHRKLWEFAYIAQAIWAEGKLTPGAAGLGFGCGREPLPSLFAKYGATILATDLSQGNEQSVAWAKTNQHSSEVSALRWRNICPDDDLLNNISFRSVDMNNIDADLSGKFDFCWSACSLEHLGSISKGLQFIRNSLDTLRSGGVAVHTTEFTFDTETAHQVWQTVPYTKDHLVEFADRLRREGFTVAELDLSSGAGLLDGFADFGGKEFYSQQMQAEVHLKAIYADLHALPSILSFARHRREDFL
jgi:2-polyprenyl-3-methyl-5-hydroxy-6-metoxy-1,4-benzoquinol methylase